MGKRRLGNSQHRFLCRLGSTRLAVMPARSETSMGGCTYTGPNGNQKKKEKCLYGFQTFKTSINHSVVLLKHALWHGPTVVSGHLLQTCTKWAHLMNNVGPHQKAESLAQRNALLGPNFPSRAVPLHQLKQPSG